MNPWVSIWLKPRQTIRQIVETDPRRFVLLLAMSAGAASLLIQALEFSEQFDIPLSLAAPVALGAGGLWGLLWLYVFGWLYRWVGSWFGGQAKNVEVRAAIAWVEVPTLAVFVLWLVVWLLSHSPALAPEEGQPTIVAVRSLAILVSLVAFVVWVWRVVLACHTIGEVHRFSAWKGLGTLAIPNLLLVVPIFFVAMFAAIAIPNVLRGRVSANESSVIGNTRALISSLEMYRSVYGNYPATPDWGRAMVRDAAVPFAPPAFQTDDALAGYEVQRYLYTYASGGGTQYAISAVPKEFGSTGRRSFYADETGTIRHCAPQVPGEGATGHDRPIDEPVQPCRGQP